ncbi:hypothetical protein BVRB_3g065170 [Beta vulgaris subsp. vulgaris]|nr:hypothetical protein BVRB_3g065170 [Beta vulgaris subsp. vulgaris]
MEVQLTKSRKRKQPTTTSSSTSTNSTPFSGILTRHKSQKFFFHHNRSGKSRKSRSFPSSLTNPSLPTFQRLSDCDNHRNGDSVVVDEDDEIYNVSIKDLRARRVFSMPSELDDKVGKNVNPNFDSELIVSELDEVDCKSDGNGVIGENPSLLGIEVKGEGFNGGNPNLSMLEECVDFRVDLKGVCLNGGNPNLSMLDSRVDLMGENPNLSLLDNCIDSRVHMKDVCLNGGNPNVSVMENCVDSRVDLKGVCLNGGNPNLLIEGFDAKDDCGGRVTDDISPNLSSKDVKRGNGEDCEENVQTTPPKAVVLVKQSDEQSVLHNTNADSWSPPKKISPSKGGSAEGKKNLSNSKRNLGLNPCSRLKVFKAPNSFSYRRMLPFLMDLAKDTPSAPKVNSIIKIETDVEEKPLVFSSKETVIDIPKLEEIPPATEVACKTLEVSTFSEEEEKLTVDRATNDSSPEQAAPCTPIHCPPEKTQEYAVSDETQIETPVSDDVITKNGGASPDTQASLDNTGKSGDISPIVESDLAAILHSPKKSPEPSREDANLCTPSQLPVFVERECSPEKKELKCEPGFALGKGILMKNPRGCRGICNCLSCASFRLNAEKAFEFSRNQLLDAEELAMDLMKELSSLRCTLEKSVSEANDKAIVPVDQVQEVCRRASDAEEIARNRLSQMQEDLQVHCRIKLLQRPRVTFSSPVQQKIMGGTRQSRKH